MDPEISAANGHAKQPDQPSPLSQPCALVLGAQGRFGRAAVEAFTAAGWSVLAQVRRPAADLPPNARALQLPLTDADALTAAARGASVVVYAVNPAYTSWQTELLPLARHGMAVARRLGALFMLPGNVYNFGEVMPPVLREDTPEQPTTRKGRLRCDLEAEMAAMPGLRSVVIRAGDFFGGGRGSWFDLAVVRDIAKGRLTWGGPMDRVHAWAYLPDLARAFVAVAHHDDGQFTHRRVHFEGHSLTGAELLAAIEQAAEGLGLRPVRGWRHAGMPWGIVRLGGVLMPMWREVAEMSYLFRVPHRLDGSALRAWVGPLNSTPLPQALRVALQGLGHGQTAAAASAAPTASAPTC